MVPTLFQILLFTTWISLEFTSHLAWQSSEPHFPWPGHQGSCNEYPLPGQTQSTNKVPYTRFNPGPRCQVESGHKCSTLRKVPSRPPLKCCTLCQFQRGPHFVSYSKSETLTHNTQCQFKPWPHINDHLLTERLWAIELLKLITF